MSISMDSLQSPTLTKADLAALLVNQIGLNKREAADMVDGFFALVANTLVSGEDVRLSGFGNFKVRLKASRPGRNPRTGESVTIPAHRAVTYLANTGLKEQVQSTPSNALRIAKPKLAVKTPRPRKQP